jgi:predicted ferric reductase
MLSFTRKPPARAARYDPMPPTATTESIVRTSLTRRQTRADRLAKGLFGGKFLLTPRQFASITEIRSKYASDAIISSIIGGQYRNMTQADLSKFLYLLDGPTTLEKATAAFILLSNGKQTISRGHFGRLLYQTLELEDQDIRKESCIRMLRTLFDQENATDDSIDFEQFMNIIEPLSDLQKQLHSTEVSWLQKLRRRASREKKRNTVKSTIFNNFSFIGLAGGYIVLCLYLFASYMTGNPPPDQDLPIQIAHAAATCINLGSAMILLPMLKGLLTGVHRIVPGRLPFFEDMRTFHKLIGITLLIFSLIHIGGHLIHNGIVKNNISTLLLTTMLGVTGLFLTAIICIMGFFARERYFRKAKFYSIFRATHRFYYLWFGLLLIHSKNFWLWFAIPLCLYLFNVLWKKTHKAHISSTITLTAAVEGTTIVHLQRPDGFTFRPGDYLYIRIRKLSALQWHPFTISSSPEKDYLTLHVRSIGSWTRDLHELATTVSTSPQQIPVEIDGPYSAASTNALNNNVTILVAGGIGITPFASILQHIAMQRAMGKSVVKKKLYVFWVCRSHYAVSWINEILRLVARTCPSNLVEIRVHSTSAQRDLSHLALQLASEHYHLRHNKDILTDLRYRTHWGRPNWKNEFVEIRDNHPGESIKLFFCGPWAFADTLRQHCYQTGIEFQQEIF